AISATIDGGRWSSGPASRELSRNRLNVKNSFSSWLDHDRPTKGPVVQIESPNVFEAIEPVGSAPPVSVDALDHHLEPMRPEALLLLRPDRERAIMICSVAGALLVGIGLGWAGCLGWNGSNVVVAAA